MQKAIIVFGGAGFIGTHLLRRLQAAASANIYSLDTVQPVRPVAGVTYLKGDVRDLFGFSVPEPVEMAYNLAAVHRTPGHPSEAYYEANILGATEVTAYARRQNIKELVFTSSISVYGPSEDEKLESTMPAPESAYGWSKLMAERIHRAWLEEADDRRLVIVRPAVVFGQGENGNFTRLASLLRRGVFFYPGRRDTIKGCIYVEDLLEAIEAARLSGERFALLNGAYAQKITIEMLVQKLQNQGLKDVREIMIPEVVLVAAAGLLKPLSSQSLGLHPERVKKLSRSTNITPGWLIAHGIADRLSLESGLARWNEMTNGKFD